MDGDQRLGVTIIGIVSAALVAVGITFGTCWSIGNVNDTITKTAAFERGYEQGVLPGSTHVQWVKVR